MDLKTYIIKTLRGIEGTNNSQIEFDLCLDYKGDVIEQSDNHIKFTIITKTPEATT